MTSVRTIPKSSNKSSVLPGFCIRYDNSTNEVDTEIVLDAIRTLDERAKKRVGRSFKAKHQEYSGHHSRVVTPLKHYRIKLKINPNEFGAISNGGLVFDGEVFLDRLVFDKNITFALTLGMSISARVFDKDGNEVTGR